MWCEIRVRGHLDGTWSTWFDGLTVTNTERGESVLAGAVSDQAALHGVLLKVRDLGIPLVTLTCTGHDPADALSVLTSNELEGLDVRQPVGTELHDTPAGPGQGDEDG